MPECKLPEGHPEYPGEPATKISTPNELWDIRYCPKQEYELINDIDLEGFEQPGYHPDDDIRKNYGDNGTSGFLAIVKY